MVLFGFEIFGVVKADLDARTLSELLVDYDEGAGQDHHGGQDPDERQPQCDAASGTARRQLIDGRQLIRGGQGGSVMLSASHSSRSSNDCAASSVSTTTAAKASAPSRR